MEQQLYSGNDSIKNLSKITSLHNAKKVFIVTGKKSYPESGLKSEIDKILSDIDSVRFNDFGTFPTGTDIEKGCTIFRKEKCDFVIGAGGGSAMDIAKAISILNSQELSPSDYLNNSKPLSPRTTPSVMIPTTAGTGSESTKFSVYYINKTKYSLEDESLIPDNVILDPQFTMTLSPYITAVTGLDALCQAIESFWSIHSTKKSREYSKQAIRLCLENIEKCVHNPDIESRSEMLSGSNAAGKAINTAKTTAAHAVSYPLSSYFGIPHGLAVALTIPNFIVFNCRSDKDFNDTRGKKFVGNIMKELLEILGWFSPDHAKIEFTALMKAIGVPTRLSELNINKNDFDTILENGFNPARVINNPVKFTKEDLTEFLEEIF